MYFLPDWLSGYLQIHFNITVDHSNLELGRDVFFYVILLYGAVVSIRTTLFWMLAINPYTSTPIISYLDRANNRMVVTSCSNSLVGCATSGWSTTNVDLATGVSTAFTLAATGNQEMLSTSIAVRPTGDYDILYTHGPGASGHLKRVKLFF